jgi:hypothetical protein
MAGPPPGAGVDIPVVPPLVPVAGDAAGLPEVMRLNQDFFSGLGEAVDVAAVSFFLRLGFSAGDSAGEALSLGDADSDASVFLERLCLAGDSPGDSAGDALSVADVASAVSFFFECLCFAAGDAPGDSAGEGLCAKTAVAANARMMAGQMSFFIVRA